MALNEKLVRERSRDRAESILEEVVATAVTVSGFLEGQRQWVCKCCPGAGGRVQTAASMPWAGVCRTTVPTASVLWCNYRIAPGSFFFFSGCAGCPLLSVA